MTTTLTAGTTRSARAMLRFRIAEELRKRSPNYREAVRLVEELRQLIKAVRAERKRLQLKLWPSSPAPPSTTASKPSRRRFGATSRIG